MNETLTCINYFKMQGQRLHMWEKGFCGPLSLLRLFKEVAGK